MRKITEETSIPWIRLLYCYPDKITDELIAEMRDNPRILKYIDLPLQHISDHMLAAMNRHGDGKTVREVVAKLRREIDRMSMDEGEKLRRMETLKYQIEEIEKANLTAGEDEELEARRKLLQNSEKIANGLNDAVENLYGGDDSDGAASMLATAERALARVAKFSPQISELHEKVADLMYQVQDAAELARDVQYELSYSADELDQIESRLDIIHKLRRKYGTTCAEILEYLGV